MPQGWILGVLAVKNFNQSVCLSVMLFPPKPLVEIQPNLVCELHDWSGEGSNIIKFQLQRFLYQHIKLDFHSVTWVMPQG